MTKVNSNKLRKEKQITGVLNIDMLPETVGFAKCETTEMTTIE